jgi:hypothetical protein
MPDGRRLVWSEEFGGPTGAVPDPQTWTPELGAGGWAAIRAYDSGVKKSSG